MGVARLFGPYYTIQYHPISLGIKKEKFEGLHCGVTF